MRSVHFLLLTTALPLNACHSQVPDASDASVTLASRAENGSISVATNGTPFARYIYTGAQFPYLYPVLGPAGDAMTRGYPMDPRTGEEHDHPHHRSLWFTHGNVNGFDFWHEGERSGRIEAAAPPSTVQVSDGVRIEHALRWVADETLLLDEARSITLSESAGQRRIDVDTLLVAMDQTVTFGDTKEGSFAVRVRPELRLEGPLAAGILRNSAGDDGKQIWGKRARWADYSGQVDGQVLGIAVFDHPDNLRHPTWWHARAYGLFAANPFGQHDFEGGPAGQGDFSLEPGASLRQRYRVLLYVGQLTAAELDAEFDAFAAQH
jgi:hypothetical protein